MAVFKINVMKSIGEVLEVDLQQNKEALNQFLGGELSNRVGQIEE